MRFTWKGSWRNGEILIEAETLEELDNMLDKLFSSRETTLSQALTTTIPVLRADLGCSDAIKTLITSEWGKQPRAFAEIKNALETNGMYFSKGTISGTLYFLTRRGDIRRFKSAGNWVYTTAKEK